MADIELNWEGACCKQGHDPDEKREALAHKTQDEQQEEIRFINQQNRKKVAELIKAPF